MDNSDVLVVFLVMVFLVATSLFSLVKDVHNKRKEKSSGLVVTATRGDKSMNALYTVYGASIAAVLVLIDNADGLTGHKVILIVIGFFCVTYLFFLSSWFRNIVFFPMAQRIRND